MIKASFHERQYELAANLELIGPAGAYFAPMQVVEEQVGYDVALIPGHAAIWMQLGIQQIPGGVSTPLQYETDLTPDVQGPHFKASLFVQYKRPEHMVRRSAREARDRASQGGAIPFFRVRFNPDQHGVLLELEARAGANAVVRYAAPLFHEMNDLWMRQFTRSVLPNSTFVAPSEAGSPPGCWTYDGSAQPIFCSSPRRGESELSEDVFRGIVRTARSQARQTEASHLQALASEVSEIDVTRPSRRAALEGLPDVSVERVSGRLPAPLTRAGWSQRIRTAAPGHPSAAVEAAIDAAVIASTAASIGVAWFLADVRTRGTAGE